MKPNNFVFHTGGWGTGEIIEMSMVREELTLEFEYVIGPKHLSFEKAFRTLIPLDSTHFYTRRFGDPDNLEKEARENPNEVIRLLLRDLGSKQPQKLKKNSVIWSFLSRAGIVGGKQQEQNLRKTPKLNAQKS